MSRGLCVAACVFVANGVRLDDDAQPLRHSHIEAPSINDMGVDSPGEWKISVPAAEPELKPSEDPNMFVTTFDFVSGQRQVRPDLDAGDAAKAAGARRVKIAKQASEENVQAYWEEMNGKVKAAHEQALETAATMNKQARSEANLMQRQAETKAEQDIADTADQVKQHVKEAEAAYGQEAMKGAAAAANKVAEALSRSQEEVQRNQATIDTELVQAKSVMNAMDTAAETRREQEVQKAKDKAMSDMARDLSQTQAYEKQRVAKAAATALSTVEQAQIQAQDHVNKAEQAKATGYQREEQNLKQQIHADTLSVSQAEERSMHAETNAKAFADARVEKTKTQGKTEYNNTVHSIEEQALQKLKAEDANCHQKEATKKAEVEAMKKREAADGSTKIQDEKVRADRKITQIVFETDDMAKKTIREQTAIAEKLKKDNANVDNMAGKVVSKAQDALKVAADKLASEEKNANIKMQMTAQATSEKEQHAKEDASSAVMRAQKKTDRAHAARDAAAEKLKSSEAEALTHIHQSAQDASRRVARSDSVNAVNQQKAELAAQTRVHEASQMATEQLHKHGTENKAKITAFDEMSKARVHNSEAASNWQIEQSRNSIDKSKENVEEAKAFAEKTLAEAKTKADKWVEDSRDQAKKRVEETQELMANYHEQADLLTQEKEAAEHHAAKVQDAAKDLQEDCPKSIPIVAAAPREAAAPAY